MLLFGTFQCPPRVLSIILCLCPRISLSLGMELLIIYFALFFRGWKWKNMKSWKRPHSLHQFQSIFQPQIKHCYPIERVNRLRILFFSWVKASTSWCPQSVHFLSSWRLLHNWFLSCLFRRSIRMYLLSLPSVKCA